MSYTQQPPSYAPPKRAGGYQAIPQDEQAPLAGASAEMDAAAPRSDGDVDPDDFKFGVTVSQSSIEIRQQFLKKVYTVLFLQILGTTVVGGIMSTNQVAGWLAEQ